MSQDLIIGEREYEFFEGDTLIDSLETCERAGYSPLFLPEFAALKIVYPALFQDWGRSMSIYASGRTSSGSEVDIYVHVPGEWSEMGYILNAISEKKLINGALPLTQKSFDALEKRNGETKDGIRLVTVMDYARMNSGKSGEPRLDKVLPDVQAFLGGEEQAEAYYQAHRKVYGNKMQFYYNNYNNDHSTVPVAHPLMLDFMTLFSYVRFEENNRVPGVKVSITNLSAKDAQPKSLERIMLEVE
ncbi:MAG: hypothetical protein Q8R18_05610 [bacterium]|nr:hypothetical protein [bacterium]